MGYRIVIGLMTLDGFREREFGDLAKAKKFAKDIDVEYVKVYEGGAEHPRYYSNASDFAFCERGEEDYGEDE